MPLTEHGITHQSVASAAVDGKIDFLIGFDEALLKLSSVGSTLTADGSEQTLYVDNEPLGCWRPLNLILDLDAMQAGDTIVVKVYHRMSDAGSLKLLSYYTWTGADGGLSNGELLDSVELVPNRHGLQVTLQQTAGTNRTYPWELFVEV